MIFIAIARFTLKIFIRLLLNAIGFGSLGPITGESTAFPGINKLILNLTRIIRCMVANLVWRLRYAGKSFCDLPTLRDDPLVFLLSGVKSIAINVGCMEFIVATLDINMCIFD
jgi:hypothetical protein